MSLFLGLRRWDVEDDLVRLKNEADVERKIEYFAAVKIQSWYRGNQLRKYLTFLHKSATTIQSTFRGYVARKRFYAIVIKGVSQMRVDRYDIMATKIQKVWRGHYTRKYKHNFYARRNYLLAVAERNKEVREHLANFVENQKDQKERDHRLKLEQEHILQARKHHYMLSTYQQNGVYASPWFPNSGFENLMAAVKPLSKEERELLITNRSQPSSPKVLPPLKNIIQPKQQGPFRNSAMVHRQRYRPMSPTLRVATSFDSVKVATTKEKHHQWTKQIHDDHMKFSVEKESYEPLIHTKTKFGSHPGLWKNQVYGNQGNLREEKESSNAFNTVVPPIPLFDKFGKETFTY